MLDITYFSLTQIVMQQLEYVLCLLEKLKRKKCLLGKYYIGLEMSCLLVSVTSLGFYNLTESFIWRKLPLIPPLSSHVGTGGCDVEAYFCCLFSQVPYKWFFFTALTYAEDKLKAQSTRYPIDDLLVQYTEFDKQLAERPPPCREFNVPMECVGDHLMVWDFCTSFGRLLHLSPFSLEDFERAVCQKGSNIVLITECHSALLRLLLKDNSEYSIAVQKKRPKLKVIYESCYVLFRWSRILNFWKICFLLTYDWLTFL